jgi:glucose/arabinose dehydrogenase
MRLKWSGRPKSAVLCAAMLVVAGCAQFNDAASQPFTTEPERHAAPSSTPPPPPPLPDKPFPKECPAPGVMQGCLESTSGRQQVGAGR